MWWIIVVSVLVLIIICLVIFVIILDKGVIKSIHLNMPPRKNQIRVACVGDSVTFGHGVKGWIRNTYPRKLGKLLGKKYCVHNYGKCSVTASLTGDFPFENTKEYKQSLSFKPDIVILMLGTNDTKPQNYKSGEECLKDCLRILSSYKNVNSEVKLYIVTPPPAFEFENELAIYDIDPKAIKEIRKAILDKQDLNVIDIYKYLEDKTELFWDGVHPNKDGTSVIAETIYKNLLTK